MENFTCKELGPFEKLKTTEYQGRSGKVFLREDLGLTGSEVSVNVLPAGKSAPFVHAHKQNEELYIILKGLGTFFVDGREFPVQEGSVIRVAPSGERAYAAGNEDLFFICIQAKAGSLEQATAGDGVLSDQPLAW